MSLLEKCSSTILKPILKTVNHQNPLAKAISPNKDPSTKTTTWTITWLTITDNLSNNILKKISSFNSKMSFCLIMMTLALWINSKIPSATSCHHPMEPHSMCVSMEHLSFRPAIMDQEIITNLNRRKRKRRDSQIKNWSGCMLQNTGERLHIAQYASVQCRKARSKHSCHAATVSTPNASWNGWPKPENAQSANSIWSSSSDPDN